jgi:hypothetical protein
MSENDVESCISRLEALHATIKSLEARFDEVDDDSPDAGQALEDISMEILTARRAFAAESDALLSAMHADDEHKVMLEHGRLTDAIWAGNAPSMSGDMVEQYTSTVRKIKSLKQRRDANLNKTWRVDRINARISRLTMIAARISGKLFVSMRNRQSAETYLQCENIINGVKLG